MRSPFRDSNDIFWNQGRVVCTTSERHGNLGGSVHGGVMMTMLDSAMGGTIIAQVPDGRGAVTSSLTVSFLEPADVGDTLVATAVVNRVGRTLAYVDGRLTRESDGLLVATATGVFALVDRG